MTALGRLRSIDADDYRAATALSLARDIADRTISPVALAELALHLAEAAEPSINAYVSLRPDKALAEAAVLETEARHGSLRSVLHGVPIAVKDNMHLAGEPTLKGSRTSSNAPVTVSAPMVARMLDAGSVVIGKTTTPEFGWKGTGISPLTGVTRNPCNTERNSGGSSAGSAATVASGAVPVALGSDAGGSIRIPASFCGVVGLKPTLGAVPVWPGTVNETLSHVGPLTRSVADARAVLELTRGADARDPQSAYPSARRDTAGRRLRVGVVRAPFGIEADHQVSVAFGAGVSALTGLADFAELDLAMPAPRAVFEAMWVTGRGLGFAKLIRSSSDVMDPGLARLLGLAEQYTLTDYYAAVEARRAFSAEMFALHDRFDLLLMPTMPRTAFAANAEVPPGGEADAPLPWITWTPYTYPFNITGQPAISLGCGLDSESMPIGMQIVGPWGHDLRVLDFAEACQMALAPIMPVRTWPPTSQD